MLNFLLKPVVNTDTSRGFCNFNTKTHQLLGSKVQSDEIFAKLLQELFTLSHKIINNNTTCDSSKINNKKSFSSREARVRVIGLEPTRLAAPDPKSGMSTNFTIPAKLIVSISGCKYNHNFKLSKEKFKKNN